MGQFSELWLYCKETFGIVKRRLFIFVPRLLMMGLLFALILLMIGTVFVRGLPGRGFLGFPLAIVFFTGLFLIANLIVESGQINLLAKAAMGNTVGMQDFAEGITRFTGRIFVGGLLYILFVFLIGISALIFVAIPLLGILAGIGMVIALVVVSVFLSAWKAAVAFKDLGVIEAFGDSYRFAKKFFWPMAVVVFVRGLFDGNNNNGGSRGNGGNNFNAGGMDVNLNMSNLNMFGLDVGSVLGIGSRMAVLAIIPMAAAAAIISIAATVYIDQLVFVIYARRENLE